jgi:hypothetical protein
LRHDLDCRRGCWRSPWRPPNSLYVNNGVGSGVVTQTDASGIGGFARVPPGFTSAIGYNIDGLPVGQIGVQTTASTLTYATLFPAARK